MSGESPDHDDAPASVALDDRERIDRLWAEAGIARESNRLVFEYFKLIITKTDRIEENMTSLVEKIATLIAERDAARALVAQVTALTAERDEALKRLAEAEALIDEAIPVGAAQANQ